MATNTTDEFNLKGIGEKAWAKAMKLNLFLFFRWKVILLLGGYIFLLAIARVILLQFASVEVGDNSWDLLIHSQGGLKVDPELPLWQYPGWVSSLAPLFFLVYQLASFTTGYDTFLLTRSGSRARWWYAKLVAVVIVSILYSIGYGLIHFRSGPSFLRCYRWMERLLSFGFSRAGPTLYGSLAVIINDPVELHTGYNLSFTGHFNCGPFVKEFSSRLCNRGCALFCCWGDLFQGADFQALGFIFLSFFHRFFSSGRLCNLYFYGVAGS